MSPEREKAYREALYSILKTIEEGYHGDTMSDGAIMAEIRSVAAYTLAAQAPGKAGGPDGE